MSGRRSGRSRPAHVAVARAATRARVVASRRALRSCPTVPSRRGAGPAATPARGDPMTAEPTAARPAIPPAILAGRVVAIARGLPAALLADVAAALHEGGVRAFEITLDSPDALAGIAALAASPLAGDDALLVGAGTVMTIHEAAAALDAGACLPGDAPHRRPPRGLGRGARGACLRGCDDAQRDRDGLERGRRRGEDLPGREPRAGLRPGGCAGPSPGSRWFRRAGSPPRTPRRSSSPAPSPWRAGGWLTGSRDPATIRERAAALVAVVASGAAASLGESAPR